MSATEACAPCAVLGGPTSTTAPALLNGTFLRREADAQKFQEYCDGLGEECPLMPTRNSVKDKGKEALITVAPPLGIGARPHAKRKTRRPHDRKELTQLGREALQRDKPTRKKGEGWKGTVVWLLEYQCDGTSLCDRPTTSGYRGCKCAVRVIYSATVEQVAKQLVQIRVIGVGGSVSLHSRTMRWDPARLRAERSARQPALHAAVQEAERAARTTRAEAIAEQRSAASSAAAASPSPASAGALASSASAGSANMPVDAPAQARATEADGILRARKREAQRSYPKPVRDGAFPCTALFCSARLLLTRARLTGRDHPLLLAWQPRDGHPGPAARISAASTPRIHPAGD